MVGLSVPKQISMYSEPIKIYLDNDVPEQWKHLIYILNTTTAATLHCMPQWRKQINLQIIPICKLTPEQLLFALISEIYELIMLSLEQSQENIFLSSVTTKFKIYFMYFIYIVKFYEILVFGHFWPLIFKLLGYNPYNQYQSSLLHENRCLWTMTQRMTAIFDFVA